MPLLLFALGATDVFNVFNIKSYVEGDYRYKEKHCYEGFEGFRETDLRDDTRTFIYREVLQSAQKYNTWWIGRSPARGNETEHFSAVSEITGREERWGNEVGILNIFTWTGIIGVILYGLVFYWASYLAVSQSKNIFSKMLGIFIAFHWAYTWVENINYFTLTTFFLWIMIGVCFSKSFREMSNDEIRFWVQGIFCKQCMSTDNLRPINKKSADESTL